MACTIVSHFDVARLTWSNRLAGIVAHRTAATRAHLTDNQRHIARIGEMERITHHLALQQRTEVVFLFLELDGSLFVGGLGSRFGASHQVGGKSTFAFFLASGQTHCQDKKGGQQRFDIQ